MSDIDQEQEAYHYHNYISKFDGAKIKELPEMAYIRNYNLHNNTPYTTAETMADVFMESVRSSQNIVDFEDIFKQKVNLSQDTINLVLSEISGRDRLKSDNLKQLYDDLLKIDNWRLERPFPENYKKDNLWNDMNKMHLQIREQIRREMKDFARDTSFPQKDLRNSLLEHKLQNQKSQMIESGLEMELDSSDQHKPGDSYQPKNLY